MNIRQIRHVRFPVKLNRRSGIVLGAAAVIVVIVFFSLLSGCGVSHSSSKGVVRSLIESYGEGSERKVKDCYGQRKNTESSLQTEINTMMAYLEAHNTKQIHIGESDMLWETEKESFVYILYNLELDNGQEYPCLGTYITTRKGGKYYIVPPSGITRDLSDRSAQAYTKFMTTDTYKEYAKEYNAFVKKNPGYEEKIATRMGE